MNSLMCIHCKATEPDDFAYLKYRCGRCGGLLLSHDANLDDLKQEMAAFTDAPLKESPCK